MPRASDQQLSLLTGAFRDKTFVDTTLGATDVLVRYKTEGGVVTDVHIAVGAAATPADIHSHRLTAEYIQRYSGFTGRARILLDQIRNWFRAPGRKMPDFGTRAWELKLELDKLKGMIDERTAEIGKLMVDGRKPIDEARLKELHAEIDNLEGQMKGYATELGAMSANPALGYIAARGLSAGAEVARQMNYPDPPDGYVWRATGNEIQPMWVGRQKKAAGAATGEPPSAGGKKPAGRSGGFEGWDKVKEGIAKGEPPILAWDGEQKKFKVKDTSGREVPYEKTTSKEDAFRMLGGEDPKSDLFAFVKMLREQGVLKSDADFVKQMQDPGGLTPRTVRDNAKEGFRQQLIKNLNQQKVIAQTETYKNLVKEGKTPDRLTAWRATRKCSKSPADGSADRGSIGERWYNSLYGTGDSRTQVSITVKVPDESGVVTEQQRNIDRMEGTTARELKNVTGAMGAREKGQIEALITALGSSVTVNGVERTVEKVVETFIDPRGAAVNVDFMKDVFARFPKANVTFELYTTRGAVIEVTSKNYLTILDAGLKARLGLP